MQFLSFVLWFLKTAECAFHLCLYFQNVNTILKLLLSQQTQQNLFGVDGMIILAYIAHIRLDERS